MTTPRVYIPSRALLRALSRPQPLPCPFARPLLGSQSVRGKRTRAPQPNPLAKRKNEMLGPNELKQIVEDYEKAWGDEKFVEKAMQPPSDEDLESKDYPTIRWWEQDAEQLEPRRLISTIETKEDRKKMKEEYLMMEESYNNPDFDPVHMNRMLIDKLIEDPNYADLEPQLQEIKASFKSRKEMAEESARAEEEVRPLIEKRKAEMKAEFINQFVELRHDPEYSNVKPELEAVIESSKILDMDYPEDPKFMTPLKALMSKLSTHKAFLKAHEAKKAELEANRKVLAETHARVKKTLEPVDTTSNEWDAFDVEATEQKYEEYKDMLKRSNRLLEAAGGDTIFDAKTRRLLNEDLRELEPGEYNREMTMEEIATEIEKLARAPPKKSKRRPRPEEAEDEEEDMSPELRAKVDKIMDDPRLMERLVYISKILDETERAKADITTINHQTAPDPETMDSEELVTLKEQLETVKEDPEHMAAIRRLHVRLRSPYNISPSLKHFNEAIEFAYIGANDDVRRVLWRTYMKARSIPTFLESVGDEAWDIIYYSQAVKWEHNRNREAHLRQILEDLKKVGRDGPPTDPRSLLGSSLEEQITGL